MRFNLLNFFFLTEIKNRFFLMFFSCFFNIALFYSNKENVLYYVTHKLSRSVFFNESYFILTGITEIFSLYFNAVIFCVSHFVILQFFYHFFCFLAPSFKTNETYLITKWINRTFFWCLFVFVFLNSVILPNVINVFLKFLLEHNKSSPYPLFFEASLLNFITFYKNLYGYFLYFIFICFFIFTIINSSVFSKYYIKVSRRLFYCFFCVISTIISPPEVFSQIVMFLILILFFEISIFNSIYKKNKN